MEQRVTQENIFGSKIMGKGKKKNLDNRKYNKSKSEIADWLAESPGNLTGQSLAVPTGAPGKSAKREGGTGHKTN